MKRKLLIAVLGHRNSGKSETWKKLFNDPNIRTAQKSLRSLQVGPNGEYTDVFLINGSPQERGRTVDEIIQVNCDPEIILCSIQFKKDAINTLKYFQDKNYFIYLHWLNPGYNDSYEYPDSESIIPEILKMESVIGKRNGKVNADKRVLEIRNYIYDWATRNELLKKKIIKSK
ncbi:hypothetical protein BKP35_05460 [Anaerobacillus arseniciselenatis]|uniref:G domain-containing protein n=1 Tax=Anaerobacillus arseniciselenatis TaxID=85682 RepID=A0A1S2LRY3_9BACI|nr:hypothetical protein [Anaerobacillus arseniciselenatis]OIJ14883.1 hypothetical protein BKP35_05460 [Anaerobacillus arseniciselenatis]